MVNMQTERTLNGQNVTQVIVRTQPNGNMDKHNQNNHPYQTMDTETNTVRYETGMVTLNNIADTSLVQV